MKSKIIVICMLLVMLCSISAVSAQDAVNETQITQTDDVALTIGVDDAALKDSEPGTFTELESMVANGVNGSTINLDKDYYGDGHKNANRVSFAPCIIDGHGHTLDGRNESTLFALDTGEVTLKNLIIKNCKIDGNGGAIEIFGSTKCTIINCTFINNNADELGGAIYNDIPDLNNGIDASLTVINTTFIDNHADSKGGAIYSKGNVKIINSQFISNGGSDGGAVYSEATVTAIASNFTSNRATGSLILSDKGGAIRAKGNIFCEDCNFTDNKADQGGAIYAHRYILIDNTIFTGNVAKTGGAIYKGSGEHIVVDHCTFTANQASEYEGGAIYSATEALVDESNFVNNTAQTKGGAICSDYVQFNGRTTFIGNIVEKEGGAVYTNKIATNLTGLYFESNTAKDDCGGALYINRNQVDVYFYDSTFIKNSAIAGDGGAIYSNSEYGNLNIVNCTFEENSATGGTLSRFGGAIRSCAGINVYNSTFKNNNAKSLGGAIYTQTLGTVENSVFISNNANQGGAIFIKAESNPIIVDNAFKFNKAEEYGGAIYINSKSKSNILRNYFKSNEAGKRGGAIYTDSSSTSNQLYLNNNSFAYNNADGEGRDVFNSGKYASISGNWWGTNTPSFDNDKLMEYHAWPKDNERHSDNDVNTVSISCDENVYNNLNATIRIAFSKDVSTYLFDDVEITSDNAGEFTGRNIVGNTLEVTYVPKEAGTHKFTAQISSQILTCDLKSDFISVYGYDVVKTQGDSQTYSATFTYDNGTYLIPGSQVIFKIEGYDDEFAHVVSADGIATFAEVLHLESGVYNVTATNPYTDDKFTNKITVNPRNLTFNINDYFVVKVISEEFANENLTLKIADKTFVSQVVNDTAYFKLDVPAGEYTFEIYCKDQLITKEEHVTVLNQYSQLSIELLGENYAALLPIYTNETFVKYGNVSYSEIGENTRRYIYPNGYGAIIYNVTVSNSDDLTKVLRKIASKDFYVDVIIINMKPATYKISESFYKDQDWEILLHLKTGSLFINGNGAVIDDEYHHSFMTVEDGTSVSIDNLTFKRFYRVFVNNGDVYCSNSTFTQNNGYTFKTQTLGSVIYNKHKATFDNCVFDHNPNDKLSSLYSANLRATIYAESHTLTNFIKCQFSEEDTIHAVDGSMVVLYDDNKDNYDLFTKDTRNNFELGSCLDYRPVASYNSEVVSYNNVSASELANQINIESHKNDSGMFEYKLDGEVYSLDVSNFKEMANPNDFRTYNSKKTIITYPGPKDDVYAYHRFLLDVGSRPVVIYGEGATFNLEGTYLDSDNHFAFIPAYGSLTIVNMTISGFNTAFVNYGQLILINCTLENNEVSYYRVHTFDTENGGAIRNYGSLYCYNTTFTNNAASNGGAYYGTGSSAFAQFYNCTFDKNMVYSRLPWKNHKESTLYVTGQSVVKMINCTGVKASNIVTEDDGLVLYRNTLNTTYLNFTVDSTYSLMRISNIVNFNRDYDVINVTFVGGDYGVLPDTTLFDMDFGQLILSGNGARVFIKYNREDVESHFLKTTAHSSVLITGLIIEGFNMAIINKGGLIIMDSHFNNNRVDYLHDDDYGGAIVNLVGATLTVYNSTFTGNHAKYGGAIYNTGIAKVIQSNFTNNSGYDDENAKVDIYNHKAATSLVVVGSSPTVVDHFPMSVWKQKIITTVILASVTVVAALTGFGIAASVTAAGFVVNVLVGAAIGAVGGSIDALIYSNDNQNYDQFVSRLFEGVNVGIKAASLGAAIHKLIQTNNYFKYVNEKKLELRFKLNLNDQEYDGMTLKEIEEFAESQKNPVKIPEVLKKYIRSDEPIEQNFI